MGRLVKLCGIFVINVYLLSYVFATLKAGSSCLRFMLFDTSISLFFFFPFAPFDPELRILLDYLCHCPVQGLYLISLRKGKNDLIQSERKCISSMLSSSWIEPRFY